MEVVMENPCEICFFKYRCTQICPDGREHIMIKARLENNPKSLENLKIELTTYDDKICDEEISPRDVRNVKQRKPKRQRKPKKINLFRKPLTFWDKVSQIASDYINKLTSVLGKI